MKNNKKNFLFIFLLKKLKVSFNGSSSPSFYPYSFINKDSSMHMWRDGKSLDS